MRPRSAVASERLAAICALALWVAVAGLVLHALAARPGGTRPAFAAAAGAHSQRPGSPPRARSGAARQPQGSAAVAPAIAAGGAATPAVAAASAGPRHVPTGTAAVGRGSGGRAAAASARPQTAAAIRQRLRADNPALTAGMRGRIAAALADAGARFHLDPWLLYAVAKVESGLTPDRRGAAGEIGLMQVLPSTARLVARGDLGVPDPPPAARLVDPAWNTTVGAAFLAALLRQHQGDLAMALSAYNAGDGARRPTDYAAAVLGVYARLTAARAAGGG